jgi:hypothetical protein
MAAVTDWIDSATDTANATEYTHAGLSFGAEDASRRIAIGVTARGSAGSAVSAMTIGGVAASLVVARTNSTSANNVAEIWEASGPTGTTGSVVVTFNGEMLRTRVMVYRIVGSASTVHDTDSGVAAEDPSASIDVPAGGVAIAIAVGTGVAGSETWSGLTEDTATSPESQIRSTGASDEFASTQTGLAVSVNFTSVVNAALVVASWGPAPAATARRLALLGVGA